MSTTSNNTSNRKGSNGNTKGGGNDDNKCKSTYSSGTNKRNFNKKNKKASKDKFKGKCKDLENHIFDANRYNQADEYIKTVREIAEFVGANYEHGADVRQAIEEGIKPEFTKPVKPKPAKGTTDIDETDEMIWKKEVDYYVKRLTILESNLRKTYSLVWGQCSDVMREKLEALENFDDIKSEFDVLALLVEIKTINFKFEDQKYPFGAVYYANKRFYNYKQGTDETNNEHYEKFNNLVSVVDSYGGLLGHESILISDDEEFSNLSQNDQKQKANIDAANARNKEKFLSFCLIAKADPVRYGDLKTNLENEYTKGNNQYPTTLTKALQLLTNYKSDKKKFNKNNNKNNVSFAQRGGKNKKYDDSWHKDAMCNHCGKKGHIKPNCPDLKDDEGTNHNNVGSDDNNDDDNKSKSKASGNENKSTKSTQSASII